MERGALVIPVIPTFIAGVVIAGNVAIAIAVYVALSRAAVRSFPMILVPAFAVPVSVLMHVLALARLRGERSLLRLVPAESH